MSKRASPDGHYMMGLLTSLLKNTDTDSPTLIMATMIQRVMEVVSNVAILVIRLPQYLILKWRCHSSCHMATEGSDY